MEERSFIPVLGGLVLTRRELYDALQFLLLTGTYKKLKDLFSQSVTRNIQQTLLYMRATNV